MRNPIFFILFLLSFNQPANAQLKRVYYVNYEQNQRETYFFNEQHDAYRTYAKADSSEDQYVALSTIINEDIYVVSVGNSTLEGKRSTALYGFPEKDIGDLYSEGYMAVGCGKAPTEEFTNIVYQKPADGRKYYFRSFSGPSSYFNVISVDPKIFGQGFPYLICEIGGGTFVFFAEQKAATAVAFMSTAKAFERTIRSLLNAGYESFNYSGSGGWTASFIKMTGGTWLRPTTSLRYDTIEEMQKGVKASYLKGWSPANIAVGYEEYINFSPVEPQDKIVEYE